MSIQQKERKKEKGFVLWFTGLSGSGKSTLANAVGKVLSNAKHNVVVLDGDDIRQGLCSDLGFTKEDRQENLRRIGEVSKLFIEAGTIVLAAFISPYISDRKKIRSRFPHDGFIEIYCKCDLKTCESRDPKGLYLKARKGELNNFTGISSPYEPPIEPDIVVNSAKLSLDKEVDIIITFLIKKNLIEKN